MTRNFRAFYAAVAFFACLAYCSFFGWTAAPPARQAAPPQIALSAKHSLKFTDRINSVPVVFSADGNLVAVRSGIAADVYDLRSGERRLNYRRPNVAPVAFSADGKSILVEDHWGGDDYRLLAVDVRSGTRLVKIPPLVNGAVSDNGRFSPDGRCQSVRLEGGQQVAFADWRTGRRVGTITFPPGAECQHAVFAAGGCYLAALKSQQGKPPSAVQVWDERRQLRGATGPIRWLWLTSASSDGRLLAIVAYSDAPGEGGGSSHRLQVWETNGGVAFEAEGEANWGNVSHDGRLLAVIRPDRQVQILDRATSRLLSTPTRPKHDKATPGMLLFLPDGDLAVWDGYALTVYDLAPLRRALPAVEPLAEGDLDAAWADLLGDSPKAQRTMWRMAATPKLSVPLIAARLKPSPVVLTAEVFERLLGEMDDALFAVREAASERLASLKERAVPFLREAEGRKDLPRESARRLALVRKQLDDPLAGLSGERLRAWRAVAVLERVGDANARLVLRKLSGGAPEDMLTREAKGALRRLADADRRARDAKK